MTAIELLDRLVTVAPSASMSSSSEDERALARSIRQQAAFCARVKADPALAAHMVWGCSARPTPADLDRLEAQGHRVRRPARRVTCAVQLEAA